MAQVTGGSDFDGVWEEWSNASLMLLREASDLFAKAGEKARQTQNGDILEDNRRSNPLSNDHNDHIHIFRSVK